MFGKQVRVQRYSLTTNLYSKIHCIAVRIESFGLGHQLYGPADGAYALGLNVLEGYLAAEAVEIDAAVGHGIAVGGQRVVRAAGIVACALGGEGTEEDAAGMYEVVN